MIQVRISPAQRRKLESDLKVFADKSKVAVAETVAIIGTSVAKELARKVQPFGLTGKAAKTMDLAIVKQVQKAAKWANYKGLQGDFKNIHTELRVRGSVSVKPPKQFNYKREPIERTEVWTQMQRKRARAGQAKAGWIAAGESIDSPLLKTARGLVRKIKGIPTWIRRHVKGSNGTSRFVRKGGLNSTIYLTNQIDYAYSNGNSNPRYVASAIADGYKRSITMVRARLKKLQ
jgi:hypothetical protein